MAVNKVDFDGQNLIDLTNDTVTPEKMAKGTTAHDKAGNLISGSLDIENFATKEYVEQQSDYQAVKKQGYTKSKENYDKNLKTAVELFDKDITGWIPVEQFNGANVQWEKGYYWQPDGTKVQTQYTGKYYASSKFEVPSNCSYSIIGLAGDLFIYDNTGKNGQLVRNYSPAQPITFETTATQKYIAISTTETGAWTPQKVVITRTTISEEEYNSLPSNADMLKPLYGKKVVCFGDSLFGMYRGTTSAPAYSSKITGAKTYNVGFGGCRMSVHPTSGYAEFSMWALAESLSTKNWALQDAAATKGSEYFAEQLQLLKSIDFNKVDIAVIHYGTNDFFNGNPLPLDDSSKPEDYNTICGALRYSIKKIQTAYPHIQIFISLPVYRFWNENGKNVYAEEKTNTLGLKLFDVCIGLANVAREYNLPIIDGYHGCNINKENAKNFLEDGTHHNQYGRKRFGEFIGKCLISNTDSFGFYPAISSNEDVVKAIGGEY